MPKKNLIINNWDGRRVGTQHPYSFNQRKIKCGRKLFKNAKDVNDHEDIIYQVISWPDVCMYTLYTVYNIHTDHLDIKKAHVMGIGHAYTVHRISWYALCVSVNNYFGNAQWDDKWQIDRLWTYLAKYYYCSRSFPFLTNRYSACDNIRFADLFNFFGMQL